jgi:hypothetical protein
VQRREAVAMSGAAPCSSESDGRGRAQRRHQRLCWTAGRGRTRRRSSASGCARTSCPGASISSMQFACVLGTHTSVQKIGNSTHWKIIKSQTCKDDRASLREVTIHRQLVEIALSPVTTSTTHSRHYLAKAAPVQHPTFTLRVVGMCPCAHKSSFRDLALVLYTLTFFSINKLTYRQRGNKTQDSTPEQLSCTCIVGHNIGKPGD